MSTYERMLQPLRFNWRHYSNVFRNHCQKRTTSKCAVQPWSRKRIQWTKGNTRTSQCYACLSYNRTTGLPTVHTCNHRILMQPSPSNAPVRRRKLLTMDSFKPTRKKISQAEREWKQVTKCLRRKLTWWNQTKLPYAPRTSSTQCYHGL